MDVIVVGVMPAGFNGHEVLQDGRRDVWRPVRHADFEAAGNVRRRGPEPLQANEAAGSHRAINPTGRPCRSASTHCRQR